MPINLEALLDPSVVRTPKSCIVARVVQQLPETYADAVNALLADTSVDTYEISARFQAAGLAGSYTSIIKHRKGLCCCPATSEGVTNE